MPGRRATRRLAATATQGASAQRRVRGGNTGRSPSPAGRHTTTRGSPVGPPTAAQAAAATLDAQVQARQAGVDMVNDADANDGVNDDGSSEAGSEVRAQSSSSSSDEDVEDIDEPHDAERPVFVDEICDRSR